MIVVPKNNRRLSLFSASTCAVAILCAASVHTAHASIPPFEEQAPKIDRLSASPNVLRAQKALSKLGLYLGPEDGHLDQATRAAIRIYQRATGIDITGRITLDMIGKLEYAVGVRKLMRQLEEARSKSITDARSKLLSHPATRDLIKSGKSDDVADPTRDATQCFDLPATMCLLSEALESAKAIGKAELRDWALGEILIAEARAGLGERAMETASRIMTHAWSRWRFATSPKLRPLVAIQKKHSQPQILFQTLTNKQMRLQRLPKYRCDVAIKITRGALSRRCSATSIMSAID